MDSRESKEADSIRRRRECERCSRRFTTYERIDEIPYMMVKKDGRRERFDRQKILSGLLRACEKRPVGVEQVENVAVEIERTIQKKFDREVPSTAIGELIMEKLYTLEQQRESVAAQMNALLDQDPMTAIGKATLPAILPPPPI